MPGIMTTQSGTRLDCSGTPAPLCPPRDMAIALSRLDVFGGHASAGFYSYAQHAVALHDFFQAGTVERAIALAAFADRLVFGAENPVGASLIERRISQAARDDIARTRRAIILRHACAFAGARAADVGKSSISRVLHLADDLTLRIGAVIARTAENEARPGLAEIAVRPLSWDRAAELMIERLRSLGLEL